jgi:WD40 repeat protein
MSEKNSKPVIFLAFANEQGGKGSQGYLRALPEELRHLEGILDQARQKGLCELVIKHNATLEQVLEVFQSAEFRDRIAIFHYGGHASATGLYLEADEDHAHEASAEGLAEFLGQQSGLELVFLNGCSTQSQARGLLDANVSAVVATSQAIDDAVATAFAGHFYSGLTGGATLEAAFKEAQGAVVSARGTDVRKLYRHIGGAVDKDLATDDFPWHLHVRPGAETTRNWNLPDAADDPLLGLPGLPERDLPDRPYRQLNFYTEQDAEVFFGRGYQIRELYQLLTDIHSDPIILYCGQSGVGKSSLLNAGLIPRLKGRSEDPHDVRDFRRRRTGGLAGMFREKLGARHDISLLDAWKAQEEAAGKPVTMIVDQVEEVFTRPHPGHPNELDDFLKELAPVYANTAGRPRGKLVLSFRKEWVQDVKRRLEERKLPHTVRYLEALDRRGIVEAIEGPASTPRLQQKYQLTIESGLAQTMAEQLLSDAESAVAPTLQIRLGRMWDEAVADAGGGKTFDRSLYDGLKSEGFGLEQYLDQEFALLRAAHGEVVESGLALDVLAFHTTPRGTAEARTEAELAERYADMQAEVKAFVASCKERFLLISIQTTSAGEGPESKVHQTRLAHDTLAPLIRERFANSNRPGQRARRILENRAIDWQSEPYGDALDEADLRTVEKGMGGMRAPGEPERRLISASVEARKARRFRRNLLLIVLAVLISVIVGTVFSNYRKGKELIAEGERAQAEACRVHAAGVTALADAQEDPLLASLLLSSLRKFDEPRHAVQVALGVAQKPIPLAVMAGHRESVNSVACSPDQKRVVSASSDGSAFVWTFGSDDAPIPLKKHGDRVNGAEFNLNSAHVLTWSDDGKVYRWAVGGGEPNLVARLDGSVSTARFYPPDDRYVMVAGEDGSINIWWADSRQAAQASGLECQDPDAVEDGGQPDTGASAPVDSVCKVRELKAPLGKLIETAEYSPDNDFLVAVDTAGAIRLWSVPNYCEIKVPQFQVGRIIDATFGVQDRAGGHTFLATVSDDLPQLALWPLDGLVDSANGSEACGEVHEIPGSPMGLGADTGKVLSVQFSPGGGRLAAGYDNSGVSYWNVDNPNNRIELRHHTEAVISVEFSSDGRFLATASIDDTAAVWDIDALDKVLDEQLADLASDDADVVAAARDRTVEPLMVLAGHLDNVSATTFCDSGSALLTASDDRTVALWNLERLAEPRVLAKQKSAALDVDLNWDGSLVAAAYDCQPPDATGSRCAEALLLYYAEGRKDSVKKSLGYSRVVDFTPERSFFEDQVLTVSKRNSGDPEWSLVQQWPVAPGKPSTIYEMADVPIDSASYSPDGSLVLTASTMDQVHMKNLVDSEASIDCCAEHGEYVNSYAAFSPDCQHVVTAGFEGFGVGPNPGRGPRGNGVCGVARADGDIAVTPAGENSAVSRADQGNTITKAVFDPDSQYLASAGFDNVIRLWSVEPLKEIRVFPAPVLEGGGHENAVMSVAFSHDGEHLVSGSLDGTARIWKTDGSGKPIVLRVDGCEPGELECAIYDAIFSRDDSRVITASADGSVRVWRYRWSDLLEYLEGSTRVRLSERQREEFFEESDADRAAVISACESEEPRTSAAEDLGKS